jgi:CO/xanthine dehydrogenase Mo-binding subunit
VFSAVNQMGQGIATSLAQLMVDVFGVPIEKVRVVLGDTDRGDGFGSAGSRSLFTGGSSLHLGAEKTLDQARELAGQAHHARRFRVHVGGRFLDPAGERRPRRLRRLRGGQAEQVGGVGARPFEHGLGQRRGGRNAPHGPPQHAANDLVLGHNNSLRVRRAPRGLRTAGFRFSIEASRPASALPRRRNA